MKVTITPVQKNQKSVLKEMLVDYQSELFGKDRGEYKYLDSYWSKPDRVSYFIRVNHKIVGFILVNKHSIVLQHANSIAEFYVEREYRNKGIGKEAAKQVFVLSPGLWEIRQMRHNTIARSFWLKVISEITDKEFNEQKIDNESWNGWVQTFKT